MRMTLHIDFVPDAASFDSEDRTPELMAAWFVNSLADADMSVADLLREYPDATVSWAVDDWSSAPRKASNYLSIESKLLSERAAFDAVARDLAALYERVRDHRETSADTLGMWDRMLDAFDSLHNDVRKQRR